MQKWIHHTVVGYVALLILIRMFAMPLACVDYAWNLDYIASSLCENKARPEMQCNGQCHLKKQLAKTADTTETPAQKNSSKTMTVDFFQEVKKFSFSAAVSISTFYPAISGSFCLPGYKGNIFHPPIA